MNTEKLMSLGLDLGPLASDVVKAAGHLRKLDEAMRKDAKQLLELNKLGEGSLITMRKQDEMGRILTSTYKKTAETLRVQSMRLRDNSKAIEERNRKLEIAKARQNEFNKQE